MELPVPCRDPDHHHHGKALHQVLNFDHMLIQVNLLLLEGFLEL
jgi:hypothetical protein